MFLAELLLAECDDRAPRRSERRIKAAQFPREKSLRAFDFDANPHVDPAVIHQLATCEWVKKGLPLCLIGDSGTGKSHCESSGGCSPGEDRRVLFWLWLARIEPLADGRALRLDLPLQPGAWARSATRLVRHLGATVTPTSLAGSALAGAVDPKVTVAAARVGCLCVGYVAALVGAGPAHLPLA